MRARRKAKRFNAEGVEAGALRTQRKAREILHPLRGFRMTMRRSGW